MSQRDPIPANVGYATVGELLRGRAEKTPGLPFIQTVGGPTHSHADVLTAAERAACALHAAGVNAGATVAVMLRNGLDAIHAWFGANLLGAADVSLNTAYRGSLLEHAVNQAEAKVLVISAEFLAVLQASEQALKHLQTVFVVGDSAAYQWQPARLKLLDWEQAKDSAAPISTWPRVRASDIASVIYTSGTTGPAKGVLMPHGQVVLLARRTAENLRMGTDDVYYSFHPLYHMAGKFMQVLACAIAGTKLVLDESFVPTHWLQRVRDSGATVSGAHGPMLEMIHAQPASKGDRDHRLRVICSAPFPRHIAGAFEQRFGVRGVEVGGMTEVGIPLWCSLDEPLREGSCGRVDQEWFEFQIVDPESDQPVPLGKAGEFVVRPKHPWTIMQGYMGMPAKTVEAWRNLWFHSGDIGHADEEGNVYFVDRAADRIRRRAESISAHDIELAALKHGCVAEAVAVGVPSGFAGDDDVKLCVACRAGTRLDHDDLLRHLAGLLPHFMVPRYIEEFSEFPRSATHKVQRGELRRMPISGSTWDRKAQGQSLRDLVKAAT